jgi:malate synthase
VSAADLLAVSKTPGITEAGLRNNISVGLQYLTSCWANGAVAIFNLMEDAATAGVSGPRSGSGSTTASATTASW